MTNCPCCGHAVEESDQLAWDANTRTFIGHSRAVRFTGVQARVFDAIWRARNRGGIQDRESFMQAVYGHDADGGPENLNIINVYLTQIRKLMKQTGYTISYKYRINHGYALAGYNLTAIGASHEVKTDRRVPAADLASAR